MVDVLTQITINKPIKEVFEYAANPDNATEWYKNIKSVEWKTSRPLEVGSKVAFVAQFMGKELAYTYEFTELITEEKLVMKTSEGPFPMATTYTWSSKENGQTLMTLRNAGVPSGFSKFFSPFMAIMMRKANKKDLMSIKKILESK